MNIEHEIQNIAQDWNHRKIVKREPMIMCMIICVQKQKCGMKVVRAKI